MPTQSTGQSPMVRAAQPGADFQATGSFPVLSRLMTEFNQITERVSGDTRIAHSRHCKNESLDVLTPSPSTVHSPHRSRAEPLKAAVRVQPARPQTHQRCPAALGVTPKPVLWPQGLNVSLQLSAQMFVCCVLSCLATPSSMRARSHFPD